LQYQNRKNEWLEGFWELVNWNDVAARFDKVRQADLSL
jgi:Fe-Mn family superoxide dismutase